jgi:hypothetical protein
MDHPVVRAISGDQTQRVESRVDRELVQRVELVWLLFAAETVEVLSVFIEPVDVIARVPVCDVDIAVGRHCKS